jgi:predicted AAA+ superfamily ATPase
MYKRPYFRILSKRLGEKRRFIQILAGPRQVGKTTLIRQVLEEIGTTGSYVSADSPGSGNAIWLEQQWQAARLKLRTETGNTGHILAIDEIQKVPQWTGTVKKLWDEDSRENLPLKIVLLGSSPLLVQQGLRESLAGRFEIIRLPHWSFGEMKDCFGWDIQKYIWFGGYPGAAPIISDENRWKNYIRDALIETTISRDILMLTRVDKPALLRQLFELGCAYSGQILSLNKILGQLQDAGNTTTLTHYIQLLAQSGMLTGIPKYSGQKVRQRASSPKFQVFDNSLITAQEDMRFKDAVMDPRQWGRLVESAVGAHLLQHAHTSNMGLYYYRENNREVDFVLQSGDKLAALEVKSGRNQERMAGLDRFCGKFPNTRSYLIGQDGIPLKEFFSLNPKELL